MENMFNFDEIEIGQDLLERTNPIFNTARMTLFQLAAADHGDAQEMVERLNLTREDTQDSATVKVGETDLLVNSIIMEARYFASGKLAMESGFTGVDLPCGFTPRALEFARSGRRYVGLDLPATVNEVEPVVMSLLDEKQKELVTFEGVDVTNYFSLKEAFDKIDGEVCITTEGLMMYLTDSELDAMCENIRRILKEHGGYWISIDPEMSFLYVLVVKAFYGDRAREVMYRSKYRVKDKSNVEIVNNSLIISLRGDVEQNIKTALNYVKSNGFKLEKLPYSEHVPEFRSLENVDSKIAAYINEGLKEICIWKLSVDDSDDEATEAETESFNAQASLDGERLDLKLSGNLDTLSAPRLLANYEEIKRDHAIKNVLVDCSDLEYVSSAGMRVLLIMQDDCKGGVVMESCNEGVIEDLRDSDILITTKS